MVRIFSLSVCFLLVVLGVGTHALAQTPVPATSPRPSASPTATPNPLAAGYTTLTTGAQRESGLFDIVRKGEDVYFDFAPEQLDREYLLEPVVASGLTSTVFAGRAFDALPIRFHRQGNRVLWEVPNHDFIATPGTSAALSLAQSTSDSVIAASPILGESATTKHLLIAPSLLTTDFEGIGALLGRAAAPQPAPGLVFLGAGPSFSVDASRTRIARTKALPKNVEILTVLGFSGPPNAPIATVPDARGFQVKMHYSIVDLPSSDVYVPREADDRVGYFVTTHKDFGSGDAATPYVRYIMRWNMRNRPIVFYLTNEIPREYRDAVRHALVAWNAAFDRIGITNAIEVRDQPNDPAWDPDDARYSTVRWITSDSPSFGAYTGVLANPVSGEIFRAEIVIDGENVRRVKGGFDGSMRSFSPSATEDCVGTECSFVTQSASNAAYARVEMLATGAPLDRERFTRDWVESVVLHEAGHAFGLRHNFAASTLYSLTQLHDPAFTRTHGLASSVMDYLPINLSPPHVSQGAYYQQILGPYDYWAIKYGYAEGIALHALAAESARPEYAYATDEDVVTPVGLDPRVSPFDLSSDPLAFDAEQFTVANALLRRLDRTLPNDTSYYDERLAFLTVMQNYQRTAALVTRYIGGEYTSRTHRGQPGGRAPFSPIPRATARRAFELLAKNVFSSNALVFPPHLVRDLGNDNFHGWGDTLLLRPDFPLVDFTTSVQDVTLNQLFGVVGLARIDDIETESPDPNAVLRLQDVFEWTRAAIFDDLNHRMPERVAPVHAELQRRFVDLMIVYHGAASLLLRQVGLPSETQALARHELVIIDRELTHALASGGGDVATRAHFEDVQARVERALHAENIVTP